MTFYLEMMDEQLIPVAGGASIPKQYHISKPGRSCGGIHTRTTGGMI